MTSTVRDELASYIEDNLTWTKRMSDGYLSTGFNSGFDIANAILEKFNVEAK